MLMPKKVKYRKQQKGKRRGKAWRGSEVTFGEYGLKAMEVGLGQRPPDRGGARGDYPFRQSEAGRSGSVFSRTSRSPRSRLKPVWAKAKGAPEGWVAVVRPGKILYEMEGVPEDQAQEAMRLAGT